MVWRCLLAFWLLLVAADAGAAEEIATPAGVFDLPDGFVPVAAQGHAAPGGRQYIFVRDGEYAPRAVFTMMVTALGAAPAVDVAVVASQFGDPTMVVPSGRPARRVKVGGIAGRRHSTTMRNDMVVTAYAVDNLGHRLLVQLKYPRSPEYRDDALRFEAAVRAFRWGLPTTPLPPMVVADPPANSTDPAAPLPAPAAAVATSPADDTPAQAPGSVWEEVERVAPGLPADTAATTVEASPPPAPDAAAAPLTAAADAAVGAVWEDIERDRPVMYTPAAAVATAPVVAETEVEIPADPPPSPPPQPADVAAAPDPAPPATTAMTEPPSVESDPAVAVPPSSEGEPDPADPPPAEREPDPAAAPPADGEAAAEPVEPAR